MCRQPELAGPIALAFVEYHRFTAVSYKLPLLDALVGAAAADRRDERRRPRRPHPGQADAAGDLRGDRAHVCESRGPARAAIGEDGISPRLRSTTQHREVHVRDRLPRGGRAWCRTARAGCSSPAPAATTGTNPEVRPVLEKYSAAAAPAGRAPRDDEPDLATSPAATSAATTRCSRCTPRARSRPRRCRSSAPTNPAARSLTRGSSPGSTDTSPSLVSAHSAPTGETGGARSRLTRPRRSCPLTPSQPARRAEPALA